MRTSIVVLSLALLGASPVVGAQEGAPAVPDASQAGGAPAPAAPPATAASETSGGAAAGAAPTGGAVATTAGAVGFFGLIAAGLFVAASDNEGGTPQHHATTHH